MPSVQQFIREAKLNQTVRTLSASESTAKLHAKIMGRKKLKDMANVSRGISDHVSAVKKQREERIQPTPERLAKGDIQASIDPVDGRRYGPRKSLVEHYRGKWDPLIEVAFDRYVEDCKAWDVTGVTMDYNGSGGRSVGNRMGGLGAAHVRKIEMASRHQWVSDGMLPRWRRAIEWGVLPRDPNEAVMFPEDIGRWIWPHIKDQTSLRMIALGYLQACGEKLANMYAHWDMETSVQRRLKVEREIGA